MPSSHPLTILRRPVVTEKSTTLQPRGKYVFHVDPAATKLLIKEAVQKAFSVKVTAVNVIHMPSKTKRMGNRVRKTSPWKKAVVTLKEGDRIELFESA